jgi:peptide/nickel transport system substrate-binding protein
MTEVAPSWYLYNTLDIDTTLEPGFISNFSMYRNEKVHELNMQAFAAPTAEESNTIYRQIQEIVYEDAPRVDICFPNTVVAFNKSVQGYEPNPVGLVSLKPTWLRR